MPTKNKILLHIDELKENGVDIMPLHGLTFVEQELHRDDHYMFVLLTSGQFVCEVDFHQLEIEQSALLYIAPGQVHRYLKAEKCEGWLLFLNPDFISNQYRDALEAQINVKQFAAIPNNSLLFSFSEHLEKWWNEQTNASDLNLSIGKSLMDAISGMIAVSLANTTNDSHTANSSKYTLASRFKKLIKENFKEVKQVKEYASQLHITPLYLNEVMNEITGFPASYWIQQEIILEAKRLIAYSDKDIKEISWDLGYEDHTYFSRFFKKNTGFTASDFRASKP